MTNVEQEGIIVSFDFSKPFFCFRFVAKKHSGYGEGLQCEACGLYQFCQELVLHCACRWLS